MSINLNKDWIKDLRNPVAGDSFSWSGVEAPAAKKSIVIHHSASRADNPGLENGFTIARYHTEHNGWGGVGYHFVITHDKDGEPEVQYVGDLATYRAHCANDNPGRVGICLTGNFEVELPGPKQLALARRLVDFLLEPNNILPSLNYHSQVKYHNGIPGQSTGCPGWKNPKFHDWFGYLSNAKTPFPSHLYPAPAPAPAPVVITPAAAVIPPAPVIPEWDRTWSLKRENRPILRPGAPVISVAESVKSGKLIKVRELPLGEVVEVVGYFQNEGTTYARTQYAVERGIWNGIPVQFFDAPEPLPAPAPAPVVPPGGAVDAVIRPTRAEPTEEELAAEFASWTPEDQQRMRAWLHGVIAWLTAPGLRLLGRIGVIKG